MLRQLMLTTFVASLAHALAALPRHAMPVSKWKRNSSNRVVTGDIRSFINCAASGQVRNKCNPAYNKVNDGQQFN